MHLRRWLSIACGGVLAILALLALAAWVFMDQLVDFWWFDAVNYGAYFLQRMLYRYVVLGGATIFFFLMFFLNFWVASRYLGTTAPPPEGSETATWKNYRHLFKMFTTGSLEIYTPISFVLAVVIAHPLYKEWEKTLLYLFGSASGVTDPVYGKDISFFLFSLPVYLHLLDRLCIAFLVLLAGLAILYFIENRILSRQDNKLHRGAKIHLTIIMFLGFSVGVWKLFLQRYELLYTNSHMPLFYGPGYVEMRVVLAFIWLCIFLLAASAVAFGYYFNTGKFKALASGVALLVLFFGGLWGRYSPYTPSLLERYLVKPNEISAEKEFIQNNIKATLSAYNLDKVETREYSLPEIPWNSSAPEMRVSLRNIPVWDGDLLTQVFEQLQEIRTYYDFPSMNVDRYTVNGTYQQVFLAGRELSVSALPEGAKTWVNLHLKYTHGDGAVMIPAAQGGEEPMTWFMQGIPPVSDYNLKLEEPSIYFGVGKYDYVIAPNNSHEIGYPEADTAKLVDYRGSGGVPIDSVLRRFIFSLFFKDRNIFFTNSLEKSSRILFRQNIVERISALTPFFVFDRAPYLVATPERMYWIQDAYTTSEWYPNASPFQGKINYIRNSVKIVVDAYNGTVDYYIADPKDPIIRAYDRIYPGLLKRFSDLPAELKSHVRYPKDIFEAQMKIYLNYHQTDPETFYKQEDVWEFPTIHRWGVEKALTLTPDYMTLNLFQEDKFEFLLLSAVNPKGRDNLRAMVAAGSDAPNYGKIVVYNFPKGQLVYGPSQIEALIDQDTFVSQQFTLWNQAGSEVDRGRMIVLPVGHAIIYIQPIYLKAAARLKIPELKRLIVSQGDIVVMGTSLEDAFEALGKRIQDKSERVKKRLQDLQPPGESPGASAAPAPAPGGTTPEPAPALTPAATPMLTPVPALPPLLAPTPPAPTPAAAEPEKPPAESEKPVAQPEKPAVEPEKPVAESEKPVAEPEKRAPEPGKPVTE